MAHNIYITHINKIPGLIKFINNEEKLTIQCLGTGKTSQVDSKKMVYSFIGRITCQQIYIAH